jgi:hypothetical protein
VSIIVYTRIQYVTIFVTYDICRKWPTKETIQTKADVEDEKNKRGERIADEDFHRFNKNNKSNSSGK